MYRTLVSPMQQAIQREISAILAKLHRINFGQQGAMPNGSSLCLRELAEKLAFIKAEMVGVYDIGEAGRIWYAAFTLSISQLVFYLRSRSFAHSVFVGS